MGISKKNDYFDSRNQNCLRNEGSSAKIEGKNPIQAYEEQGL